MTPAPLADAAPDISPPASSEAPALELERVAHRFGAQWVLRGCSLRVERGEAVALVGSNGAGKTTLLRVAATLLRPARGGGRVLGADLLREADAVRERVGMLGVSAALYEDLTAEENLRFACRMRGLRPDARTIARALDEAGLATRPGARVREFSSGMRRRAALARLLLFPPKLLLLDEPYASFDPDGIDRVNDFVRQVKRGGGAAVVATHDLPRAADVVERVVRLEQGVLSRVEADDGAAPAIRPAVASTGGRR